jgi:sulfite reductase (ferredoxin)
VASAGTHPTLLPWRGADPSLKGMLTSAGLPTRQTALAESERVAESVAGEIEQVLAKYDLENEKVNVRLAGSAHGDSRPYTGDIGIIGTSPNHYAVFAGGNASGTRLAQRLFENVPLAGIAAALDPLIALWKTERNTGEGLGDFCHRFGIENLQKSFATKVRAA